ncbi:hypothetical protein N0V82_001689 [Gnomoniopsis sp. IMI 355080]|nr:hypothetical protein N0V82_001689 [Gnomoniopsis sp. IMI 355080]
MAPREEGIDRTARAGVLVWEAWDTGEVALVDVLAALEAENNDEVARVDVLAAQEAEDTGEVAQIDVLAALEQDDVWEALMPLAEVWPTKVDDWRLGIEVHFFGHGTDIPGPIETIGVNEALVGSKNDGIVATGALLVCDCITVVGLIPRIVVEDRISGNENGLVEGPGLLDLGRAAMDVHRAGFEEVHLDGFALGTVVDKAVVTVPKFGVGSSVVDLALLRKGQTS